MPRGPGVLVRFNPPPGWPVPPGWTPPEGWDPETSWPAPPPGWQFWVEVPPPRPPRNPLVIVGAIAGSLVLLTVLVLGVRALVQRGDDVADDPTTPATTETTTTEETESTTGPTEPETYTVTNDSTGLVSAEAGACTTTEYLQNDSIETLPLLDCSNPHDAEVFAVYDLADGDYPGDAELKELAEDGCSTRFEEYIGAPASESEFRVWYIHPTEGTWTNADAPDREVICIAYLDGGPDETGSWAGSGR